MSDESSTGPHPFDVPTIQSLVALMSEHDLNVIDLRDGKSRICIRRGQEVVTTTVAPATVAAAPVSAPAPSSSPAESAAPEKDYVLIKSPTPGTFYAQEKPGADPFVKAGSRVTPSSVVGLIEAMKLYNEVTADCNGVIVEVCVSDGQAVEFDTVLFKVDPTG